MGIEQFLLTLARRWFVAVGIFCLVVVGTAAYTVTRTPMYEARADVFVTIAPGSSNSLYQDSQYVLGKVKSYVQLVDKPIVLEPAIDETGLDLTVAEAAASVTATNEDGTSIISVSVEQSDPVAAAELANAIADQLQPAIKGIEAGDDLAVKATTVSPATVPSSASSPRVAVNLALGALGGLLLALAGAFALDRLDTRVRTEADVAGATELPNIGSVQSTNSAASQSILVLDPAAPATESFRTIRARLRFVDVDHPPRLLLVTSSIPREGKTTVSVNLATILAQTGSSVCLIDADFRRPGVARALGIEGSVGLADVLAGDYTFDVAKQTWGGGLFTVLTAGTPPPDPADLLGSEQMASLLGQLQEEFDYVVCDTPPLGPVADAAVLAPRFDGTILVARHGRVNKKFLQHSSLMLRNSGAKILGTVFNAAPRNRAEDRYQYTAIADVAKR